ncbi:MAG: prephenate dehydrogenase [Clostridiales bacterium]|jgi:prephenate dehydrogenase|nr:prephenate dehydrogenase [Clostridiales bacterium]
MGELRCQTQTDESDFNKYVKIIEPIPSLDNLNIGFIGFGLIGGSIARALKKACPSIKLIAYDYRQNPPSSELQEALFDQILDAVTFSLEKDFTECDLIFLCAPVLSNINYLQKLKPIIKKDCILTDVGSVKGNIHKEVEKLNLQKQFIGGHPMTGSEKTGYRNSYALLMENAYYILTPTDQTPQDKVDLLYHLVQEIGSIPILLDAQEHDEITAAISHVPHIIAAQLVNLVKNSDDKAEKMRMLAAGGFKDITRIASSSPIMWQNICLTNADSIKALLDSYIESLKKVSLSLSEMDQDYLFEIFDTAKDYRNSIPNTSKGIIQKVHEIYMDIKDEAGAIATIATLLAVNQISIKNIGIIHNREFEEGVLRIEFYEEESKDKAAILLKDYNYNLYLR